MGPDKVFVFQQVLESVIGLASCLGNALVLYVIVRCKSLRTVTNYLIASLAMADLLVGAIGIPCVIVNNFGFPDDIQGCLVSTSGTTQTLSRPMSSKDMETCRPYRVKNMQNRYNG